MQGTIKKFVRDRGFGFIQAYDGREIFFHRSSLQQIDFDALKEGEKVEFDVERAEKGAASHQCARRSALNSLHLSHPCLSWSAAQTEIVAVFPFHAPRAEVGYASAGLTWHVPVWCRSLRNYAAGNPRSRIVV